MILVSCALCTSYHLLMYSGSRYFKFIASQENIDKIDHLPNTVKNVACIKRYFHVVLFSIKIITFFPQHFCHHVTLILQIKRSLKISNQNRTGLPQLKLKFGT